MDFFHLMFVAGVTSISFMTLVYIISIILKNSSIVDIAWGLGFILITIITLFLGNLNVRSVISLTLTSFWGLRLALHIYNRNKGKPEDWRYKKWREDWGSSFLIRSYFQIFLTQGILLILISIPLVFINSSTSTNLMITDFVGIAIWIVGFFFETIGDLQLTKFKSNKSNKGKIMKRGLWRYTRHPNYFGEVTLWWGIYFLAISIANGIYTIIGPLTITYLILKVSGIPLLEKKYEKNKEFQEYKKKTSAFFPWFSKS